MVASLSPAARLRQLSAALADRIVTRELDRTVGRCLQAYVCLLRMLLDTGRVDPGRALAIAVVVDGFIVPPLEADHA